MLVYSQHEVRPRSTQEAVDVLRHCLEEGEIIPGSHFRAELAKENVTFEDAWSVLRKGRIYDPAETDIKTGELKFRIEGQGPGGKWLVIIFCFKKIDRVFLITIFSSQWRGKPK